MSDDATVEGEVCYIGLGANLRSPVGEPLDTFQAAVARMPGHVEALSPVYATAPVGPPQPEFVNAALRLRTRLAPLHLLAELLRIERDLGRDRTRETRWGPRSLDLDVLLWPGRTLTEPQLRVPHPRLHERAFALAPLLDVLDDATSALPAGFRAQLEDDLQHAGGRPPFSVPQPVEPSSGCQRSDVVERGNAGYPDGPRKTGAIVKS